MLAIPPLRQVLATPDKPNATGLVEQALAINDTHPDYPALLVANHLLGGDAMSRLWSRIREKDGLSYDVRSGVAWNNFEPNSRWQASAIFAPQNQAKVEAALQEEVARALKDGFTAQELGEGQTSLLNFRRLSRAQDAGVVQALANNLYLGRTFALSAKVDAALAVLTLEQVNAALRQYVTPDNFVSAYVGDFKP
jgi:zinc protease